MSYTIFESHSGSDLVSNGHPFGDDDGVKLDSGGFKADGGFQADTADGFQADNNGSTDGAGADAWGADNNGNGNAGSAGFDGDSGDMACRK